jgi:cell division protein FtsI (penicillin-binding protein 3)
MRYLLRLNVEKGTAKRAEVEGYYVGGKTGTSEKVVHGRYSRDKLLTVFTGVFPSDEPQYLVLVMIDEPKNGGHATAGLNAAPTTGQIIARIGPLLGVEPRQELPSIDRLMTVSQRAN